MNRYLTLLFFGLFFTVSVAYSQLTIEVCQEKARNNYPLIKQYGLIEQSEVYNLSNANKGYLPQLSFSARATYQSDVTEIPSGFGESLGQMTGADVSFPTVNKDQYQLLAEVNQIIWDGGAIGSQKNIIKATTEVEKQRIEMDLYTLRERVNQLFFGILALDEQLQQTDLLQTELETNLNKVKAYVNSGIANQSDIDAIRVEQLKIKQRKVELASAQKSYKQMLAAMINDKESVNLTLVKPDYLFTNTDDFSINRPELKLFEAQNMLLESQKNSIQAANMPKIGLFAQGGYGNPGLNMFKPGFTPYYIVGARLTWNFSGLYTRKNNLAKIESDKQNVDIQRNTFMYNTHLKMLQENNEIEKIREQLKSDDEIIALRKSIKRAAEVKTENGTLSVSDLIREINAENAAIVDKSLHEIQLLMAIYNLKHTTNN